MKTITIIDLFNKIANGEEVPKKIRYCMTNFKYDTYTNEYLSIEDETNNGNISIFKYIFTPNLNDEVEIIEEEDEEEEEKEIPERIQLDDWIEFTTSEDINNIGDMFNKNSRTFVEKINKIIDYLESKEEVVNYKDSSIK